MSDEDKDEVARLERLNEKLSASLLACRALLNQYRERAAANSNDADTSDEGEESQEA